MMDFVFLGQICWVVKDTICSLIQDDIRHTKLLNRLQSFGIEQYEHILNVSESVFNLVGLNESPFEDIIVRGYFDLINVYQESNDTPIDQFTESLYAYLMSFSLRKALDEELDED
jgi:hypothetical protein